MTQGECGFCSSRHRGTNAFKRNNFTFADGKGDVTNSFFWRVGYIHPQNAGSAEAKKVALQQSLEMRHRQHLPRPRRTGSVSSFGRRSSGPDSHKNARVKRRTCLSMGLQNVKSEPRNRHILRWEGGKRTNLQNAVIRGAGRAAG
nr:hypothetical protein CFP56_21903 [Quercus suber]